MKVNPLLMTSNPFIDAYSLSDTLGKLIFIALIFLSICSWIILIYKSWTTFQARRNSLLFQKIFESQKGSPLTVDCEPETATPELNSFRDLYFVLRKQTMEMLNKNRLFGTQASNQDSTISYLSTTDIDVVEAHLFAAIASQTKRLESNLYL